MIAHSNVRGDQYTSLPTHFLINYEFQCDIFVRKVSLISRDFLKLTPKYVIYDWVNLKNLGEKWFPTLNVYLPCLDRGEVKRIFVFFLKSRKLITTFTCRDKILNTEILYFCPCFGFVLKQSIASLGYHKQIPWNIYSRSLFIALCLILSECWRATRSSR